MRTNPPPHHQTDQLRSSRSSSPAAEEPADGDYLAEHRGYFSGSGFAARCLRWHLAVLVDGTPDGEGFTDLEVESCIRQWLEHGERSHRDDRLEDIAHRLEEAAADALKAAVKLQAVGIMFDADDPSSFTLGSEGRVSSIGRAIRPRDFAIVTDKESRLDRDLQADGETEGEGS